MMEQKVEVEMKKKKEDKQKEWKRTENIYIFN